MKKEQEKSKNKNEKEMDIVFLLDRSGSMGGLESDTIGGYNSYLRQQRDKNAKVTTILFDDQYEVLHDRKDINDVKKLTSKEYYVRGCTALLDAIGKTIKSMDLKKTKKVMFVITTDGYENASREYSKEQIKELIKGHSNWEFIYIGAGIDSYSEGSSIGIKTNNISNYVKDKKGMSKMFGAVARASSMMYEEDSIESSWKEDLESYIDNNIENN